MKMKDSGLYYDCGAGIFCTDGHYEEDRYAAIHIAEHNGHAALFDTAHNASLPYVLRTLDKIGVKKENVDYVCLTHVHLDHAGGAGLYMREFPNAKLVVHPKGAFHMEDPSKLMKSVRAVYGDEQAEALYGDVLPIEKKRIIAPEDGETLPFGDKGICCFYTLGHAKHHMSFFEENSRALFAGDAFGLSYSWMTPAGTDWTEGLRWTIPTTSPTQFDPLASIESYNQILKRAEGKVYLTHFGELRIVEENAALLTEEIKDHVEIAIAARGDEKTIKARLAEYYGSLCEKFDTPLPKATIEESLAEAIELNAQGLAFWFMNRK